MMIMNICEDLVL